MFVLGHACVTLLCVSDVLQCVTCSVFLFVSRLFKEGAYLKFKSIFLKSLQDGMFVFCYLRILKEPAFSF